MEYSISCIKKVGFILALALACFFCANTNAAEKALDNGSAVPSNWLIEVYMCGSDLESDVGAATLNLSEIEDVSLPDNIKILVMAGGTKHWQNEFIKGKSTALYLFDNNGLRKLQDSPQKDMGSGKTLASFLKYGKDNFPADHRMLIFWNHGGGSANGVCLDENTKNMLSLNDIENAFSSTYSADENHPPFDMITFDACLMGSIDTARCLQGYSSFFVASEDIVPGLGLGYSGWIKPLVDTPDMETGQLGKVICDAYMANCQKNDVADNITLSVIDMSKFPQLWAAYERFGEASLTKAISTPQAFFVAYDKAAYKAENYGSNTDTEGYSNMLDLGGFAANEQTILPEESLALQNAVSEAVTYRIAGKYRRHGHGLSFYYFLDGDEDSLNRFIDIHSGSPFFKALYSYQLNNKLTGGAYTVTDVQSLPALSFGLDSLKGQMINIDDGGQAWLQLTQAEQQSVSEVHFRLVSMQPHSMAFLLGTDNNDLSIDAGSGLIRNRFAGQWGCLDGHLAYMDIVDSAAEYNIYAVPINFNGNKCTLRVVYNKSDRQYDIQGVSDGLDSAGMADRSLVQLKEGDQVTMLYYKWEDDNFKHLAQIEGDSFQIGSNPSFYDKPLNDGRFCYMFEFVDPQNHKVASQQVVFQVQDGTVVPSAVN